MIPAPGSATSSHDNDKHDWLRDVCADEPLWITVRGSCMSPLIDDGARLKIARSKRYYPGDILVCRTKNGNYQVHRLLGSARWRGGKRYITRGDNTQQFDGSVEAGQVLGRVTGGECKAGAIVVPLTHRLAALGQFAHFTLIRLFRTPN